MRIGLGSDIFSSPLTIIGKVSPRYVTSQAARTRLNVYLVALRQQPASEHFTLLGFLVAVAISVALVGLHLRTEKEAVQPLPYFSLKKVVNLVGVATNLADLRFDTGEGYNRFHTLQGFYQNLLTECLKSESRKKKSVYYITSNSRITRSAEFVIVRE